MDLWGYVTGGVGAAAGLYGAWRSWRTDRRFGLLDRGWTLERLDDNWVELTSRLGYVARDVEIEGEGSLKIIATEGPEGSVPPGGFLRLIVLLPWQGSGTALVVRWNRRTVFGTRPRSARVPYPAKNP